MKWKKLGRLFDPTGHHLANNCTAFAKAPQTLMFEDFVRIYFSAVETDITGKYLSHISFVDMDRQFKKIINISSHTVIELGGPGCFDEHGIFPMNVVRDADRVLGYTTGWNRKVSVSADASIGVAISYNNGSTFKKIGEGPILTSSLYEPFLIGDGFVVKYGNTYHMWYIYGTKWSTYSKDNPPDRVYKIGHATSTDGITWRKEGKQLICDKLCADECQALPCVIRFGNRYHMFFCYRFASDFRCNKNRGYRIGYAFSHDLQTWIRDDESVGIETAEEGWDSEMLC